MGKGSSKAGNKTTIRQDSRLFLRLLNMEVHAERKRSNYLVFDNYYRAREEYT